MKFGRSVWLGDKDLAKAIFNAKKLGFDYIELCLDWPWPSLMSPKSINTILRKTEELGLGIGLHGPWWGLNLAHPDPIIQEAGLKIMLRALEFSAKFNLLYFNFHIIIEYSKMFPKFEEIFQAMNRSAMRSAREIFRRATQLEINATLENEPKPYYGLPSQFKEFSKISDVNFCIDVGHVARIQEEEVDEDCSWDTWFNIVGDRLLLVHLNDCIKEDGKIKDHRVLGEGYLDFKDIGERVKKTDAEFCTLECFESKKGEISPDELKQCLGLAKKCF